MKHDDSISLYETFHYKVGGLEIAHHCKACPFLSGDEHCSHFDEVCECSGHVSRCLKLRSLKGRDSGVRLFFDFPDGSEVDVTRMRYGEMKKLKDRAREMRDEIREARALTKGLVPN